MSFSAMLAAATSSCSGGLGVPQATCSTSCCAVRCTPVSCETGSLTCHGSPRPTGRSCSGSCSCKWQWKLGVVQQCSLSLLTLHNQLLACVDLASCSALCSALMQMPAEHQANVWYNIITASLSICNSPHWLCRAACSKQSRTDPRSAEYKDLATKIARVKSFKVDAEPLQPVDWSALQWR